MSSSWDPITRFQPQTTEIMRRRGCQCYKGHRLGSRAVRPSPQAKMSLCKAPPEAVQENFPERASLIHERFFLPRGDFYKIGFYLALRWPSRHLKGIASWKAEATSPVPRKETLLSCHCSQSDSLDVTGITVGCLWLFLALGWQSAERR